MRLRKNTRPARRAPQPAATSPVQPLALSLNEAAYALGIGRSAISQLVSSGALRAQHVGRRVIVPVSAIENFLANGAANGAAAQAGEDGGPDAAA